MASAIRFDAHIESSKSNLNYEPRSSSHKTQHPNETVVIITPPDDSIDIEPTDSNVEEVFAEYLPSNEPAEILIMEEMQSLDDAEDGDTDTSAMVYKNEDLSLNWELSVRYGDQDAIFDSHQSVGYSRGSQLLRIPMFTRSPSAYWLKIRKSQLRA